MAQYSFLGRSILNSFCLFFIIFGVTACREIAPGHVLPTIKIGLAAPFEGLHRPLGYEALFGVKLALQERNLAQGMLGYRVELVALNDFDDPAEAQAQARALAADPDVLGVVGHLSSDTTLAALPIYQEAQLAMSIPWSIAGQVDTGSDGVVMIAASRSETSTYLETRGREMGFNNTLALFEVDDLEAISEQTQALYLAGDGVTAGEIVLTLHEANVLLPVFGQVDVGSPQLLQVARAAANDLIFVSPGPDPQDVPGGGAFIEAYQALAGFLPGPRAVLAYDAAHVLLDAIEQAILENQGRPTRAEVRAALPDIQRRGMSGDIAFDPQGERIDAPLWVYQISEEKYPGVLMAP